MTSFFSFVTGLLQFGLAIALLFLCAMPFNCSITFVLSQPSIFGPSPTPCPPITTNASSLVCTLNASDILGTESSLCVDGNVCTKDILLSDSTCVHRSFPSTTSCSTACNINGATSGACQESTCTLSNPEECLGWCPYEMKVCTDTPANCVAKIGCPLLPIAPPLTLPNNSNVFNSTIFYTSACIFNSCRYLTVSDILMWSSNFTTVDWIEETCDQLLNNDDNRTKETCFTIDTIRDTNLPNDDWPSGSTFCSYAYTCMLFNASAVPFTITAADAETVGWGNLSLPLWMNTGHPTQNAIQVAAYSQMAGILLHG